MLQKNPNTICIIAGDFLNPSIFNTIKINSKKINGKHMVDILNDVVDIAIVGNHDLEFNYDDFQTRIDESKFTWLMTNVKHFDKNFKKGGVEISDYHKRTFFSDIGEEFTVCFFSLTTDYFEQEYITYKNIFDTTSEMLERLKHCHRIIPITHLPLNDDIELAKRFPYFNLIMGGHDHHNMKIKIDTITVTKADANAKSAYIHTISKNQIISELVYIDSSIPKETFLNNKVQMWQNMLYQYLRDQGFEPLNVVKNLNEPYDATELTIRNNQANIGQLVLESMIYLSSNSKYAFINSGLIRIDDVIKNKITEYDVLKMMPYKNKVLEVEMHGKLLNKVISKGNIKGTGSYLQLYGFGGEFDDQKIYKIVINDFLLSGLDYDFLTHDSVESVNVLSDDLRKTLINYCKLN